MKTQVLIIFPIALLAACHASVLVYSADSIPHRVTEIKLLRQLTVAPDTTRVFVQDGRVLAAGGKGGQYRPRCAFEVVVRSESEQVIQAGSFTVTRIQGLMDEVVEWKPVQLAAFTLAGMDNGGAPMVTAGYHFWLASDQPNVMRMTCYGVFEDMPQAEAPNIEEIDRALDGVAELTIQRQ